MIALLSPAKTFDGKGTGPPALSPAATRPRFVAETDALVRGAARLGRRRIAEIMHISPRLVALNAGRFAAFDAQPEEAALYAFAGDVYRGFDAASAPAEAVLFAQDHLRILSGLYGLLRPLDPIRPYRLEMGTSWAPRRKSLTGWWGDRIAAALRDDLAAEGSGVLLNLASQEYFAAVAGRMGDAVRIIDVDFREMGPDGPRFVSFAAKRARGTMARWLCDQRAERIADLQRFDADGYAFDPAASTPDRWRFIRERS